MEKLTSSEPGFAPVPIRLLADKRISDPTTIAVYCALASFIDYGTGKCFPSLRTIGERARCSDDTARRHVEFLVQLEYVVKRSGKDTGKPNVYHLADAWGRQATEPMQQGCRTHAAGGTAPVPDKRDLLNENQKREREARPVEALPPVNSSSPEPTPISLSALFARIKQEAWSRRAPLVIGRDWSTGIAELVKGGASEAELIQAFTACVEAEPERVTFFPRDFLKWRKASRKSTERDHRAQSRDDDAQQRVRQADEERQRILAEQESEQGRALVEASLAALPWKRR